jgi:hypothetical protein
MKNILIILGLSTLISCDPVRRHNRLVDKYPYVHKDVTQIIHDTVSIVVPKISHDTTFIVVRDIDTFIIEKERLKVTIRKEFDTLYVDAECDADTITIYRQIKAPLYTSTEHKHNRWKWWVWLIIGLALGMIIRFAFQITKIFLNIPTVNR